MDPKALMMALSSSGRNGGMVPGMPTMPVQGVSTAGGPLQQRDFSGMQGPGGGGQGQGIDLMAVQGPGGGGMGQGMNLMPGAGEAYGQPNAIPFNPTPVPEGSALPPEQTPWMGAGPATAIDHDNGTATFGIQGHPFLEDDMMSRSRDQQDMYLNMLMRALGRG
jgi:hypothetical protein